MLVFYLSFESKLNTFISLSRFKYVFLRFQLNFTGHLNFADCPRQFSFNFSALDLQLF